MRLRAVALASILLATSWSLAAGELGLHAGRPAAANRWLADGDTGIALGQTIQLAPDRDPFLITDAAAAPLDADVLEQLRRTFIIAPQRGFGADLSRPWVEGDGYAVPLAEWNRVPLRPYLRVNYFRPYDNAHGESVVLVAGFRF